MKTWQYYDPEFEFTKELPVESSAWSGHYFFAYDLIANLKPEVVVELGTHKGNSAFSFAQAVKDLNLKTELHCIDTWIGDKQAGFYGDEIYEQFLAIKEKYYKNESIIPHKKFFDEAVEEFESKSIDLLHIDGLHTYEAVKHDFDSWLPKVKKNGIIMLHDVCEKTGDYGVYQLWEELESEYSAFKFSHFHGLGIVFLEEESFKLFEGQVEFWKKLYENLSINQGLESQIKDTNVHVRNLESIQLQIKCNLKEIENEKKSLDRVTGRLSKENSLLVSKNRNLLKDKKTLELNINNLTQSNTALTQSNTALTQEVLEFRAFKQGLIWKFLTIYRKIKHYPRNFILNLRNLGLKTTVLVVFRRIKQIFCKNKEVSMQENPYDLWLKTNKLNLLDKIKLFIEVRKLEYKPLISIVMPVYNVDVKWIKAAVKSVKSQIYPNWELCIADDASTNVDLKKYLKRISKSKKIKVVFREKNGHISEASNSALKLATGEFIALMDNDDVIHPQALAEVVNVLNKNKKAGLIYSDEDKLELDGSRVEPFFKPDWSPDLFLSTNYLCHFTTIRKSIIDEIGGFRKGFEGSQDYDLFLRVTEKTNNIEHIPQVLYSWRKIPGSTAAVYSDKNYAEKASVRALEEAIDRRGLEAKVEKGLFPCSFRIKYKIQGNPLVSILIPTKDKFKYIERCISSLLEKTTYQNIEIVIIDTGSTEKEVLDYYKMLKSNPKIKIIYWKEKFNYSAVNNFGVKNSKGKYVLLLNNDTEIISPDWIEGMLEHAQRDEVGAVGAKLYYPNDTIQHAGVILGINGGTGRGVAGHAFKTFPREIMGFPVQKDIMKDYSAVTAACLMISRKKYNEVGGLDEKFRIAFNDVDFNLKLIKKGYYNIYTPYVELYHHESVSVGTPETATRDVEEFGREIDLMYERWEYLLLNDPFYNKNLTLKNEDYSIGVN